MGNMSPWIDQFSTKHKQLVPFIRGAISEGLKPTATYNVFKADGMGVSKQKWFRMWNGLKETYVNPDKYLDQTNPKAKPIISLIPPARGQQNRSYLYNAEYIYFDPATGVSQLGHKALASTNLVSVEDVYSAIRDIADPYHKGLEIAEDTIRIKSVTYSATPIFRG